MMGWGGKKGLPNPFLFGSYKLPQRINMRESILTEAQNVYKSRISGLTDLSALTALSQGRFRKVK